jgi:metallophosphoesterase (TIGR00282 family)
MKVLLVGDVIGEPGRKALARHLPEVRERHGVDYLVVNVENLAGGFGVTPATCAEILALGAHVLTSGNHIWDKKEVFEVLPDEPRLLRPHNYPPGCPGSGLHLGEGPGGVRVAVLNLQGRVFMPPIDCPFRVADAALESLRGRADVILVDFHGEATSEKVAMGWHLDGRVAAVVGTHTHVQTADERILPGGTAYLTDLGMTGPYDSVIGVETGVVLGRFLTAMPARFETAKGNPHLCGAVVDVDPGSGRARAITRVAMPAAAV